MTAKIKPNPTAWKAGQSGNPNGRPKGAKSKVTVEFFEAVANDFAEHGAKAIERMRIETPAAYIKMIASLMPKTLEIERPLAELSDAELLEAIDILRSMIKAEERKSE